MNMLSQWRNGAKGRAAAQSSLKISEPWPETDPLSPPVACNLAVLGSSFEIKGSVTGKEDLQIDAKIIGGPVVIAGHRLIVGLSAELKADVTARELIVYGKIKGNVNAIDHVEIKRDAEVIGDIQTSRISIEDGAAFKGYIEVGALRPKAVANAPQSQFLAGVDTPPYN